MLENRDASSEVVFIGAGLDSLEYVDIPDSTYSANFHGNFIKQIQGFASISLGQHLRILDLSGNLIHNIEGLELLVCLRSLNLAGNVITTIGPGLANLRFLESLNLSYNRIMSPDDLQCFANPDSKLNCVHLHGNLIVSLPHVIQLLQKLVSLGTITFEVETASNPFCSHPTYPNAVWSTSPYLHTLDGKDRQGNQDSSKGVISVETELAGLLEFLTDDDEERDSSLFEIPEDSLNVSKTEESISSASDNNLLQAAYPKIDAVLSQFRQNGRVLFPELNTSDEVNTDETVQEEPQQSSSDSHQLTPTAREPTELKDEGTPSQEASNQVHRLLNIEQQLQQLLSLQQQKQENPWAESLDNSRPKKIPNKKTISSKSERKTNSSSSETGATTKPKPDSNRKLTTKDENMNPQKSGENDAHSDSNDTYLRSLLTQLDEEREKRWRAQQTCEALGMRLKEREDQAKHERSQVEDALSVVRRLQGRLSSGKATQEEMERQIEALSNTNEKVEKEKKIHKQREAALQRLLTESNDASKKSIEEQQNQIKTLTFELDSASRQAKLVTAESNMFKAQVIQMKNLITEKEKEHQDSLKGKYSIGSAEIQTLLTKEGDRISEGFRTQIQDWKTKYRDLEDEFRLALHMEADRFSKLQVATEGLQQENASLKTSSVDVTNREARASALVKELSDLAKDQKQKLTDMSRTHQSANAAWKKRAEAAEAGLATARERLKDKDGLVKAKGELERKCAALETLIKGIKAEKELWSAELAHQGAALSQDRGRLEAKVEALTAEVVSLKKQLERDTDALRIKGKVIDDQTETINKLKHGLVEKDKQVKDAQDSSLALESDLKKQLQQENQGRLEAEERIDYLEQRKQELKNQIHESEEESSKLKTTHEGLVQKWKERSKLIDELEKKVTEMKAAWDEKERKLVGEKEKAVKEKEEARAQTEAIDAAFRSQLDQTQASHVVALEALEAAQKRDQDAAHLRLLAAEDEMRAILQEAAENKRLMDAKIQRLTSAFTDLQT